MGLVDFEDAETGELFTIDTSSIDFRNHFNHHNSEEDKNLAAELRRRGIDAFDFSTSTTMHRTLQEFFRMRENWTTPMINLSISKKPYLLDQNLEKDILPIFKSIGQILSEHMWALIIFAALLVALLIIWKWKRKPDASAGKTTTLLLILSKSR